MSCLNSPISDNEGTPGTLESQPSDNTKGQDIRQDEERQREVPIPQPPERILVPTSLTGTERTSFTECAEILYAVIMHKPYRNGHFEVVPAWMKVLDQLKRDGYCKELSVQWLRDRVGHLIEFYKEGGFSNLEESAPSTVPNKRKKTIRKKYNLTADSVGSSF